jgi:methyl-accepting chemotaxis protein
MKLVIRISLLIGILVLFVTLAIGIVATVQSTQTQKETVEKTLLDVADLGSLLLSSEIHAQLDILQELANRVPVRSMDWETQSASLKGDIERSGYLDFAIVDKTGQAHYIKDSTADLHDRDYIIHALSGKQAVSDVLISRITNTPVIMNAVPITAEDSINAPVIGVLIGRRAGNYLSQLTKQIQYGDTGYSLIVNREGTIIANPTSDLVHQQFNPITEAMNDLKYETYSAAVQAALHGRGNGIVEYTNYMGKKLKGAYAFIPDFGWTLLVTVEYDEFMAMVNKGRNVIFLMVIVFLLVGIIAAVILALSITKPIYELDEAANAIARLEFDIPLKQNRSDELGILQASLLVIRDNMQKKVLDMNQALVDKQINIANNLKEAILNSSQELEVITNNMDAVRQKTDIQVSSVDNASDTVTEIVHDINAFDEVVETQALNISRSSESIEQMVKDTESVHTVVHNATQTTQNLGKSAEESKKMLGHLMEELKRIAEQSVFLEEANATLVNIAAQTNILAMNAAIEAAHAGESGRGFAVVAGEIRTLAVSSDKESTSISQEIKRMRIAIANIQKASNQTVDAMSAMFTEVTDMGSSFERVNTVVEAQAANSSQVLKALSTLKETTEQVKNGSGDIQKQSALIQKTVEHLNGIAKDVNESMLDVEKATKNIDSSLEVARKIAEGRYLMPPN